jgi:hypothetical protein
MDKKPSWQHQSREIGARSLDSHLRDDKQSGRARQINQAICEAERTCHTCISDSERSKANTVIATPESPITALRLVVS